MKATNMIDNEWKEATEEKKRRRITNKINKKPLQYNSNIEALTNSYKKKASKHTTTTTKHSNIAKFYEKKEE